MSDRQVAVALRYLQEEEYAPRVVAKGWGAVAEEILRLARKHNIPIHPDRDLAQVLVKLDLGQLIPPELYQVVAEVLAYLYRMNRRAAQS
ncbi:MAG: EscU/YscU/HrcU family type III secretion system export apparatus switch protein [Planctomycetes bacterium]|nr:EscU/YscU/HrcU family type III secretion system export apparatus switch protein [Planctomycetota bacterium]